MMKTETLEVARVRGASVVKLVILGSVIGCTLITSVFGIVALFGGEVVHWNGKYVTGAKGLVVSPLIGFFIGILFGLLSATFTYVGLRFYSLFRGISLEYVPAKNKMRPTVGESAD